MVHNYITCQVWSTIVRPGVYLLCGTQLQYMSNMVNHSKARSVSSLWYTTTIHVKYGQPCIFSVVHNYNTCQIWSTIVRPGPHNWWSTISSLWYTTTIHVKYGQPWYLLCGTQLQYMSNMVNHSKTRSVSSLWYTTTIHVKYGQPWYLLCGTQLQYMSNMVNHSKTRSVSSLWYTTTIHVKYGQP